MAEPKHEAAQPQDGPTRFVMAIQQAAVCPRDAGHKCDLPDAESCCGGGYDAPCDCTTCHPPKVAAIPKAVEVAENRENMIDVAAEIRDAINGLTQEVKQLRLLLAEVIDQGAGQYPGRIRIEEQGS